MFIFLMKKSKPRESHEQVQSLGFVAAEDFGVMRPLEPSPIQQTWHFLGEKTGWGSRARQKPDSTSIQMS